MSAKIRHIVAIRFKAGFPDTAIETLMDELGALQDHLPGVSNFSFRRNISPETVVVHGFHHVFWFDFEDEKARDAYLTDAQHQAIGAKLLDATDGGVNDIQVLDFVL